MRVKWSFTGVLLLILLFSAAAYAKPGVNLSVVIGEGGSVASSPAGINCPSQCDSTFAKATQVTLTAAADPNHEFVGWTGACTSADPTCTFKLTKDTTVTAAFDPLPVASPPAPVSQTGQVLCYDDLGAEIPCAGTGQDGDTNSGVAWPSPRFAINGDGTVTDNLTGLVWLRQVDCFHEDGATTVRWSDALAIASTLESSQCGLTDGSVAGDWRVPNAREIHSLRDFQFHNPSISNASGTGQWQPEDPFICESCYFGVAKDASQFWSSTTHSSPKELALTFRVGSGSLGTEEKTQEPYSDNVGLWPVRDAQ